MFATLPAVSNTAKPSVVEQLRLFRRWPVLAGHLAKGVLLSRTLGRASDELRVAKWQADLVRYCGIEIEVKGEPIAEASLWVANHISWLDAPVLGSLASSVFVAKDEVREWPVVGNLVKYGGTLFIKRGANQVNNVRDQMVERLAEGRNVVVFPEATTTVGDRISYLFPRLMSAALIADVPVQPVAVRYSLGDCGNYLAPYVDDMRFLPHLQGLLRQKKLVCTVEFLPVIDEPISRDELASRVRQSIASHLNLPASRQQKLDIDLPKLIRFLKSRHGI